VKGEQGKRGAAAPGALSHSHTHTHCPPPAPSKLPQHTAHSIGQSRARRPPYHHHGRPHEHEDHCVGGEEHKWHWLLPPVPGQRSLPARSPLLPVPGECGQSSRKLEPCCRRLPPIHTPSTLTQPQCVAPTPTPPAPTPTSPWTPSHAPHCCPASAFLPQLQIDPPHGR